ncbi:translation initiation factor IF-3 [candidate division WOR-3 bacterium]|nr:translation initiation factor IF-3 [candidate division WOR-3 bacterium]
MKYLRINRRIRSRKVRLIDSSGAQRGTVSLEEALRLAGERYLDLVEIVPTAHPPVCKIMDYGKYKYEQSKREKHKHKIMYMKEIKLKLRIQKADKEIKSKRAEKFLTRGHKVKVTLRFRGREIIYSKQGKDILLDFAKSLDKVSSIEQFPKVDGKIASILLIPKRSDNAKSKDT